MFKLSPSKLNLFLECPLCFWLQEREGIKRPAGVFPSLPGGMDNVLKKYYDKYEGSLPPELIGRVEGKLLDKELIKKFRSRKEFFFEEPDAILCGALDACLIDGKEMIIIDFKTRGYELKEDSTSYYQNQMDCYALIMKKKGIKITDYVYLIYYIPVEVKENGRVEFKIQIEKMKVDSSRTYKVFRQAVELLKGERPEGNPECSFCRYRGD